MSVFGITTASNGDVTIGPPVAVGETEQPLPNVDEPPEYTIFKHDGKPVLYVYVGAATEPLEHMIYDHGGKTLLYKIYREEA